MTIREINCGMSSRLALVALAVLVLLVVVAHAASDETRIPWQEDRPLTWDDFLADVPANRDPKESSSIAVSLEWKCSYELRRESLDVPYSLRVPAEGLVCVAMMDPLGSWRDLHCVSSLSLRYMQMLFDISHVYGERLRMELLALDVEIAARDDVNAYLQSFARRVLDSCHLVIRQCEKKTAFGTLPTAVETWREDINRWMAAPETAPIIEAYS